MKTENFTEQVREVVRNIKPGSVMTYKEVACLAGSPRAARAVGNIMRNNYDPTVPCHRVVSANGVGGYNRGGSKMKEAMLQKEGVTIK